jgi:myo-inositol-1(or 4)-monophosphatase
MSQQPEAAEGARQTTGAPGPGEVREVALEAAQAAGELLRQGFGKVQTLRFKGEVDLVTELDERSEKAIADIIRSRFPHHRILAEEGSVGGDDQRHRWIVDPLDGTTNYAHGLPFFCVSIAYEQDGRVEVGAIYDPLRDEMFLAQRGRGVSLNGRRLAVSTTDVLLSCLLATGFPYDRTLLPRAMRYFEVLSRKSRAVRRLGSAALDAAYVAAGRLDCYWETIVSPWDVAAGWLMVAEAGGRVTDLAGAPFSFERGEILASNGAIHDAMLAVLAEANAGA